METTLTRPITVSEMEITFRREMLGWLGAVHFTLQPLADDDVGMFALLTCKDRVHFAGGSEVPSLRFLVTPPGFLWPEFEVELDESFADALDLTSPTDAALLAIVTQREPMELSTVNLYSPIVVNRRTGMADQFVPSQPEDAVGWQLRTPLPLPSTGGDDQGGRPAC